VYWKSVVLRSIDDDVLDTIIDHAPLVAWAVGGDAAVLAGQRLRQLPGCRR
jgi:hypothetical protein